MPRVKLDYVVSFSCEDADNPASNLLQWDISKKKWLCPKGEPHCSVVLQLTKSTKISAVHVGAFHAALVEVLVGRSETPNDQFQVLVPSSIFLSPTESRKEENVEKVRSFSSEQFAEPARNQKWDRVRVVCSQPYNKHCKYGLSFIQIYEPESLSNSVPAATATQATSAVPPRLLALDPGSSDEDEFRPGQLFATQSQSATSGDIQHSDTGAQIRQASSQALKNISDTSSKLVRTPLAKTGKQHQDLRNDAGDRQRASLMYEEEDAQIYARIDRVLQRHKDKNGREGAKGQISSKDDKSKRDKPKLDSSMSKDKPKNNSTDKMTPKGRSQTDDAPSSGRHKNGEKGTKKRTRHEKKEKVKEGDTLSAGPVSDSPHTLLAGVVFVLSGYENPRRGQLRTAALAMGARCERDWGPRCTHLICAFPNTPKLRQVRAAAGGARAAAVKGEWVEQCAARRRLLPWQWFATEPGLYVAPKGHGDERAAHSECDTDDEIEKVLSKQKKRRLAKSPSPREDKTPERGDTGDISRESDIQFMRDERIQGNVTVGDTDSDATDEDVDFGDEMKIDESKSLPNFLEGHTFLIDESAAASGADAPLLGRYVRAYGGLLLQSSQLDEESEVDFVLCGGQGARPAAGLAVRADWLWKCHEERRLCPTDQYRLTGHLL